MSKKVLKICCSKWENASRDVRELSLFRELGADVLVMTKGNPGDYYNKDCVEGFDVFRFSTRPLGKRVPKTINRIVAVFAWAHYARKMNANVISGHDLSGLAIGYLSNLGRRKERRAKLIYDSHEFELGRATERSRTKLWFIKRLEGFLIKRSAFSIMVNDSIADEVQKIHKLKDRPIVVRSTPDYWELDAEEIAKTRAEICRAMGVPEETFLIMYHGGIMPQRNIEALIDAVARNSHICGIVLGNAISGGYLEQLKNHAGEVGAAGRIYFHPAVPIRELYRYVGAADAGTILVPSLYRSYHLSLPNKFFENIQSMTPVIASELPEVKKLIEQYGIGLTVDITKEAEIDAAIERMRTDKRFYSQCKENLRAAKLELCWENEKKVLIEAIQRILD